jgi:hypothetical protein
MCITSIPNIKEKMSAPVIVNVRNFDVNKVTFTLGPKKPGRMPTVNMKYEGQPFNLRFPNKMSVRMFARTDQASGNTSYTLLTNMKGCDAYARERASGTTDVEMLYNLIVHDLKSKILSTAEEKSKEWFGKTRARATIEDGFKDMYRVSGDNIDGEYVPNGKYPPSMTIKIPVYDNKVVTDVINESGNPVYLTPDTLGKVFENNIEVNIVASPSIYIMAGGSFGVTWRLNYAQVFQRSRINAASVFAAVGDESGSGNTQEADEQAEEETIRPSTPVEQNTPAQSETVNVPPAPGRKKRSAA